MDDPTTAFLLALDVAATSPGSAAGGLGRWRAAPRVRNGWWSCSPARASTGNASRCAPIRAGSALAWYESELVPETTGKAPLFERGRTTLRVPLVPGSPGRLFMPRLPDLCGGRVVAVTGAGSRVDEDGRAAALSPGGGEVELAWDLGSPECAHHFPRPRPPFFVEGDAEIVAGLEALLRRHEP